MKALTIALWKKKKRRKTSNHRGYQGIVIVIALYFPHILPPAVIASPFRIFVTTCLSLSIRIKSKQQGTTIIVLTLPCWSMFVYFPVCEKGFEYPCRGRKILPRLLLHTESRRVGVWVAVRARAFLPEDLVVQEQLLCDHGVFFTAGWYQTSCVRHPPPSCSAVIVHVRCLPPRLLMMPISARAWVWTELACSDQAPESQIRWKESSAVKEESDVLCFDFPHSLDVAIPFGMCVCWMDGFCRQRRLFLPELKK